MKGALVVLVREEGLAKVKVVAEILTEVSLALLRIALLEFIY
jgi:hypothetical protein